MSKKKVFYGGWWRRDWLCRRGENRVLAVARCKCQAPDWGIYTANVAARKAAAKEAAA